MAGQSSSTAVTVPHIGHQVVDHGNRHQDGTEDVDHPGPAHEKKQENHGDQNRAARNRGPS